MKRTLPPAVSVLSEAIFFAWIAAARLKEMPYEARLELVSARNAVLASARGKGTAGIVGPRCPEEMNKKMAGSFLTFVTRPRRFLRLSTRSLSEKRCEFPLLRVSATISLVPDCRQRYASPGHGFLTSLRTV